MEDIIKKIDNNNRQLEEIQTEIQKNYPNNWDVKYIILIVLGILPIIGGINLMPAMLSPVLIIGGFSFSLVNSLICFKKDSKYRKLDNKRKEIEEKNKFLNCDLADKKAKVAVINKDKKAIDEGAFDNASKEALTWIIEYMMEEMHEEENKEDDNPKILVKRLRP